MRSLSSIPRSSSYPDISSSAKSHVFVPPSNRSVSSARSSSKFSYWPHWSYINQLGNLIIPGKKSSDSSSKSDLTEESLEAHNRRHAPIIQNKFNAVRVDEKNAKCSPYYQGLADASLVINRERLVSSPGCESHATTVATSTSSSLSSFIIKTQEWSSCFTFKSTEDYLAINNSPSTSSSSATTGKKQARTASSTTSSLAGKSVVTSVKEMNSNSDEEDVNALSLPNKEKPLRERVSETESSTTLPPNKRLYVKKDDENKNTNTQENIEEKNEKEFTWANKYQPKTLKDFICNRDKAIQLQDLVKEGGGGNFIFEGPPGVGKRTMIWAMLREAFGPDRVQGRASKLLLKLLIKLLPGYEKHVIIELMKGKQSKISSKASQSNSDNTRAIILCEADKLSTDALLYIRWLLERYKGLNKVFFCCSDVSKLQPIKTLCTVIQLFPPSKEEIVEVLEFIAKEEGIEMSHKLDEKIAQNSKNNLRQAIRSFETSWQRKLYIIRGKLQNLIEHDVSLHFIFKSLVRELKKHLDAGLHRQIDSLYDEYNMDDGGVFDNEKPFVFTRSRYEETAKRLNDPAKKKF